MANETLTCHMTNEKRLIELLLHGSDQCLSTQCDECKYDDSENCQTESIVDYLIANGVTVQQWIPASEPPKKSAYYIVMIRGATIPTTLYYRRIQKEWVDDDSEFYNITHWMPLPEPPNEVASGKMMRPPKGDENNG